MVLTHSHVSLPEGTLFTAVSSGLHPGSKRPLRQRHGIDPAQQGAQDDARRQDPTWDLRAQGPQGHGPGQPCHRMG